MSAQSFARALARHAHDDPGRRPGANYRGEENAHCNWIWPRRALLAVATRSSRWPSCRLCDHCARRSDEWPIPSSALSNQGRLYVRHLSAQPATVLHSAAGGTVLAGAPNDASRAWAILIMTLGSTWATMVAGWITPFVAGRWGWRAVPYVYGSTILAVTALWQTVAHESPQAMLSQVSCNGLS